MIRTVWINWIALNRNVFDNWTVYLFLTEMFEIEQFICIKVDLALTNLQRLICHLNPTNQSDDQDKAYKKKPAEKNWFFFSIPAQNNVAHLTGAVEYTDCFFPPRRILWSSRLGLQNTSTAPCREVRFPNKCPVYDTKQSDGEAPVMLELWEIRSTSSLLLLPCPL